MGSRCVSSGVASGASSSASKRKVSPVSLFRLPSRRVLGVPSEPTVPPWSPSRSPSPAISGRTEACRSFRWRERSTRGCIAVYKSTRPSPVSADIATGSPNPNRVASATTWLTAAGPHLSHVSPGCVPMDVHRHFNYQLCPVSNSLHWHRSSQVLRTQKDSGWMGQGR
jgi:hypothetical protein